MRAKRNRTKFNAPGFRGSLLERFERKFEPEPNTGCWLWTGSMDSRGYGQMRREGRAGESRLMVAPRLAWLLFRGQDPGELDVCHRCDHPPCVNPDHLFLGTASDNSRDMMRKGRNSRVFRGETTRGTKNRNAKLTADRVHAIRAALAAGRQSKEIALAHGVSRDTVYAIRRGRCWGWLP